MARRRIKASTIGLAVLVLLTGGAVAATELQMRQPPPPATAQAAEYLATVPATPTPAPVLPVMSIVGDSFALADSDAWPKRTARCAGYQTQLSGVRGSGFVAAGEDVPYGSPKRVAAVTKKAPSIIILETAYNDSWRADYEPETVEKAITETIKAYKASAPKAKIVVVGPFNTEDVKSPGINNNKAALETAAKAAGVTYIDAMKWLPSPEYIGPDGKHPSTKGHRYIAGQLLVALKNQGIIKTTSGCENLT